MFKPGDKVRCINAFDTRFIDLGQVYTVVDFTEGYKMFRIKVNSEKTLLLYLPI